MRDLSVYEITVPVVASTNDTDPSVAPTLAPTLAHFDIGTEEFVPETGTIDWMISLQ